MLNNANIGGFLDNLEEFYEIADSEGQVWREFVTAWWNKHFDQDVGVAELFTLANETETLDLGKSGKGTERSQRISFGKQLASKRDRVIGEHRIMFSGKERGAKRWRLASTRKSGECR